MFLFSDDPLFTDEELFLMCAASGGKTVQDTATGNPLTFLTDLARPLKSLLIPFTPVQSGTGDPSPQNIRPILPWNGLTVWNGGTNQWDELWEVGSYDTSTGQPTGTSNNQIRSKSTSPILVRPNTQYYVYVDVGINLRCFFYDEDDNFLSSPSGLRNSIITSPAEAKYMRFHTGGGYGTTYGYNIAINYPASVTSYEPYHQITETSISFSSPVYGGTLDVVSGVLTVTHGIMELDGTQNYFGFASRTDTSRVMFNGFGLKPNDTIRATIFSENSKVYSPDYVYSNDVPGISENQNKNLPGIWVSVENSLLSETTIAGLRAYLAENPITVCYPLATPQTVTLTPEQLTALVGNNTIWSDADGQMTAVYLKKG